jgi:hypothetical protein
VTVRRARKEEGELYSESNDSNDSREKFDEGKNVTPHHGLSKARRPGHEQRRVNVDFLNWIIRWMYKLGALV